MDAVLEVNEATKRRMLDKITAQLGDLDGRRIAVLGLSFKPDTDDIRESPALTILEGLDAAGARVKAFDPASNEACREILPQIDYVSDPYEAVEGAEATVIVTEWNLFRALELQRLRKLMAKPLIIDLRNLYEPDKMAAAGFSYVSVGRPEGRPESGGDA